MSSTAPRTANRPPGAAASPAPVPASPPPAPAAPRAAAPAPSAAPVPATVAEIYNRQLPGTAAPQAAPAPRPATAVPAQAPAASVDQVYRQQLARSEAVVQLRQPVAEPPPPLPAQPRRIGALQHTARETGRSQVAYVGGSTGVAPMAIRPGEPVSVIRFGEGSARLGTADRETVARIAAMANEVRGMVRIVGHAGRPGGGEGPKQEVAEFGLSLDRANAVAQELMRNGISADRLKVEAVGDAEPLVIAGSAAAEAANRRAEIFIE
ncbi:MAG: hypothetical protein FJX54_18215 [Alphaproteobacteria bacterium]|nr:hypothetical protein [Alphaproteobacteria bacterium]